jgi:signal transduction histidine kinase/CheY-like chemotaxis protein
MTALEREAARTNGESMRRGQLLLRVARIMGALTAFAFIGAIAEPANPKLVSVAFYGTVGLTILAVMLLAKRGYVTAATWLLSSFFWLLVAFATLFFGGLRGENAATFCVCVMLVGAVLGGRAAIIVAVVSSLWCLFIAWLEMSHALPKALGVAYSPINGWIAITVTLLLTSVFLRTSIDSLKRAHAEAAESARERDQALARSIEAQKMEIVGNLSGGIAHDFNNLLTVIAGSTSLLRSDVLADDETAKGYIDDIESATSRATLMTRQLLSFGGGRINEHSAIDLAEVVRSMGNMLPRLLGSRISVRVSTPQSAVVLASRAGLEQILLNLSVNARDAMPEGGELTIELRVEGETALLTARDTGVGINEETLKRIFEPFFTTKSSGTGLGLSTVQSRVQQFGGTIEARSEPGKGSTFIISLPVHSGKVPRVASKRPDPQRNVFAGRALLVEDDGLVRRTVARILDQTGFDVTAVANGAEALGVLGDSAPFSVIVTDLSMPLVDGRTLARKVRERWPHVPIVLMSGNASIEAANDVSGTDLPILAKPVDKDALVRAIRAAAIPVES